MCMCAMVVVMGLCGAHSLSLGVWPIAIDGVSCALPMEAWVYFSVSRHFYEAIMLLCALAMSSLSIVATHSGWVDMGVPFLCSRMGYFYWDGSWFRPSWVSFCTAIAAILIRFPRYNDLDQPSRVSFSLGFPMSLDQHRWTIVLVILRLLYHSY